MGNGMELTLNFGWVVVAVWMLVAWLRLASQGSSQRRGQMVALAVVVLILLPAISMTDDLVAAQNPAEAVTCVRRDHDDFSQPHSIIPLTFSMPLPAFAGLLISTAHRPAACNLASLEVEHPFPPSIQNRPPPAV